MAAKKHRPGKFSKDAREQKNLVRDTQNKMFHAMIAILAQTLPEFKKLTAEFVGPDYGKIYTYDFLVEKFQAASESCSEDALSQKIEECVEKIKSLEAAACNEHGLSQKIEESKEKIKNLEAELKKEKDLRVQTLSEKHAESPPCVAKIETDSGVGSPPAAVAKSEAKRVKQLTSEINLLTYEKQKLQKNLDQSDTLVDDFKAKFNAAYIEAKNLKLENEKLKPIQSQRLWFRILMASGRFL